MRDGSLVDYLRLRVFCRAGLLWSCWPFLVGMVACGLLLGCEEARPATLCVFPDSHRQDLGVLQVQADHCASLGPTVALHLGDVVDRAQSPSEIPRWSEAVSAMDSIGVPYHVAIGNHDFRGFGSINDPSEYLKWFDHATFPWISGTSPNLGSEASNGGRRLSHYLVINGHAGMVLGSEPDCSIMRNNSAGLMIVEMMVNYQHRNPTHGCYRVLEIDEVGSGRLFVRTFCVGLDSWIDGGGSSYTIDDVGIVPRRSLASTR